MTLSVAGIVGIVAGSVFVIGCLICVITLICICKRRQNNRSTVIAQPQPQTYPGTTVLVLSWLLRVGPVCYAFVSMLPPSFCWYIDIILNDDNKHIARKQKQWKAKIKVYKNKKQRNKGIKMQKRETNKIHYGLAL